MGKNKLTEQDRLTVAEIGGIFGFGDMFLSEGKLEQIIGENIANVREVPEGAVKEIEESKKHDKKAREMKQRNEPNLLKLLWLGARAFYEDRMAEHCYKKYKQKTKEKGIEVQHVIVRTNKGRVVAVWPNEREKEILSELEWLFWASKKHLFSSGWEHVVYGSDRYKRLLEWAGKKDYTEFFQEILKRFNSLTPEAKSVVETGYFVIRRGETCSGMGNYWRVDQIVQYIVENGEGGLHIGKAEHCSSTGYCGFETGEKITSSEINRIIVENKTYRRFYGEPCIQPNLKKFLGNAFYNYLKARQIPKEVRLELKAAFPEIKETDQEHQN